MNIDAARHVRPRTRKDLWNWVRAYTGVNIPHAAICEGHSAPFTPFAQQFLDHPSIALWCGPRGSGKSYLSGLETHCESRFSPRYQTKILGGSAAQSAQIYEALKDIVLDSVGEIGNERDTIKRLLKREAEYENGSHVSLLAASSTSVRGPHIPCLKLDEVDEIDDKIFQDAIGMVMSKKGYRGKLLMTSTWHKPGGPMSKLLERAKAGEFPGHTWCMFEVLETCPESRSGPRLELCPSCPIKEWCHSDLGQHPSGLPKAKRSCGHYTIDSFIQKSMTVSPRVFAADYLCLGPQIDGAWFADFDPSLNVTSQAEYNPSLPVHISIDSGVVTGAVLMQFHRTKDDYYCWVFDEYLNENAAASVAARDIMALIEKRCPGARRRVSTDSAGGSRNVSGTTVVAEYERVGLRGEFGLEFWPKHSGSVLDSLGLMEASILAADGKRRLFVHPRCKRTIEAIQSFSRMKVNGHFIDQPKDEDHPFEDLVDPIKGALKVEFPESRKPKNPRPGIHPKMVF